MLQGAGGKQHDAGSSEKEYGGNALRRCETWHYGLQTNDYRLTTAIDLIQHRCEPYPALQQLLIQHGYVIEVIPVTEFLLR